MTDDIGQLLATHEAVRSANAAFYRACEARDGAEISKVWSHYDDVKCIHPGWRLLRGWPAIRASWKQRFEAVSFMKFGIEDMFVDLHGDLALVSLTEVVLSQTGGVTKEERFQASNLFRREGLRWKLVHHHSSTRE